MTPTTTVLLGGWSTAFVFGAIASRSNFCTMGAVADVVNMGHWGRARSWMLALAVAMLGANALYLSGLIDLSRSVYHRPVIPWLSLVLGGAVFGIGMTLAGGCPNKNLIRLGQGSLRSLVVLVVLGVSGYMTLKGLFATWRAAFLDPFVIDVSSLGYRTLSLPSLLSTGTGWPLEHSLLVSTVLIAGALLAFVFQDPGFRKQTGQVASAVALGLLISAGWYVTGHLGFGENEETLETVYFATNTRTLESLTFVGPVAYALELLMLWSDKSLHATFGIATVLGASMGALAMSVRQQSFQLEGFASVDDLRRHLTGAVLMGFGGVTSIGCTIGQGLSGLSTLAPASLLAVAGIVAGSALTMKWMARDQN